MGSVDPASFSAVAISAAQDLFEIVAPADARVRLLEIDLGQCSDFGDELAETCSDIVSDVRIGAVTRHTSPSLRIPVR